MALKIHPTPDTAPVLSKEKVGVTNAERRAMASATKLKRLARAAKSGSMLSPRQIQQLEETLTTHQIKDREDFLELVRSKSGKSDEELIAELRAKMDSSRTKEGEKRGRGRPKGATKEVQRERWLLAWRLHNRGLTPAEIGAQMEVSHWQADEYLKGAKDLLRVDPLAIDVPQQIGETLNFFEDIRSMAMFIASQGGKDGPSNKDKIQAMGIALKAEFDKNSFLGQIGVYAQPVAAHLQALVMQQMSISLGQEKKDPVDSFFTAVAGDLLALRKRDAINCIDIESVTDE